MYNFHQVIQSPTRCANILDWFVINNLHLEVLPPLRNLDISLIFLELDLKFCTDFLSSIKCWDYSRADFKKLNEILLIAPWEDIIAASPTPDVALNNITDIINQRASTCIPFRILESKKSTSVDAKAWINLNLKKMIHKRRRLFAKWRRTQCRHHRLAYNRLRNKIQRYIKDRKNRYIQFVLSKLDSLSTSRPNFWKTVKDLLGKRSYSNAPLICGDTVQYDMTSKANIFNEYFTSISTALDSILSKMLNRFHMCTDLFIPPLSIEPLDVYHVLLSLNPNKSKGFDNLPNRLLKNCAQSLATPFSLLFNFILATSHFPTAWNIASVITLHKSGSLHDVKNYRPISILPSLSKVFEKLIHKHLYSYFETNNLLCNRNSGFRKYHSTTSNILEVTHKLLVAKDSGCSSRVVFLDISKAFDKVIHSALLFKLQKPKFLPLQIIHLFILHYDSATKH